MRSTMITAVGIDISKKKSTEKILKVFIKKKEV